MTETGPRPPGRVLATLNEDGSRRWLRPKPSLGRFWRARRLVAYVLMLIFFAIPYLSFGGKPAILLDIPQRRFTLFGTTFLPTDTLLLMLLMVGIALGIFLLTAMVGRAWCGWACPQTVYMEFLFRPIERWLEGGRTGSTRLDREGGRLPRQRVFKYLIYFGLALFLAHTFLAYFVGIDQLVVWVRRSPVEHPTSFLVMAGTTAAIFANFTYFREQTCLVACPYGRLQSVLLDRQSVIVGYDSGRGEPRHRSVRNAPEGSGDCIDCGACVLTCPTGIDIRDGLQMECIHCTQCIDACDQIMDRVGRPRGLIRYSSEEALSGGKRRLLRPRVVFYPVLMAGAFGALVYALGVKSDTDVTLLRGLGAPFIQEANGDVVNQIRVKVTNRKVAERRYQIRLDGAPDATLVAPINPLPVAGQGVEETSVFIVIPASGFQEGRRTVSIELSDGGEFVASYRYTLVGPDRRGDEREDRLEGRHRE